MIEFSQDPGSELVGFGRNLVEIVPRSLPELFKQLGDQNNRQKHQTHEHQNFKNYKIKIRQNPEMLFCSLGSAITFHEDSDFQVKNKDILHPEAKKLEKRIQKKKCKNQKQNPY